MIFWAAVELGRPYDLVHRVWDHALIAGINPLLVVALVEEESRFKVSALGRHEQGKGTDYGLFQLNSDWHPQFRGKLDEHIRYGVTLLRSLLMRFPVQRALSHYNTGRDCKVGRRYAARVLKRYTALRLAISSHSKEDPKAVQSTEYPALEQGGGGRDSVTPPPSAFGHLAEHLAGERIR